MGIGEEREEVERRIETQDSGPQLQEDPCILDKIRFES